MIALFDWDGVVADSMPHLYRYIIKVLNMRYLPVQFADFKDFRENWWSEPYPKFYERMGFDWAHNQKALYKIYKEFMAEAKPDIFPGMREVFRCLNGEGIKVGIVSSSAADVIERDARRYGIRDCIDTIVGVDTLPTKKKMKPHPAPLLIAQHRMKDYEAIYVGDMPSDLEAATRVAEFRAKPIPFIMVTYGYTPKDKIVASQPNLLAVVDSPGQIFEEILIMKSFTDASRDQF